MKSGTRDEAEGKWHKVNGKIKKIAGTLGDNLYLEQKVKKKSESAKFNNNRRNPEGRRKIKDE
jgi:uncharacterized protein YjbJ (UPF0337 family)